MLGVVAEEHARQAAVLADEVVELIEGRVALFGGVLGLGGFLLALLARLGDGVYLLAARLQSSWVTPKAAIS